MTGPRPWPGQGDSTRQHLGQYREHGNPVSFVFLPSLQERLKDDAPGQRTPGGDGDTLINAARMRELVRDALVALFNTTNMEDMLDAKRHSEACQSVINYGLPPLTGAYVSDMRWEMVERMVRQAIVRFEPRIIPSTLSIRPPEHADKQGNHMLQFVINAMLHMEPHPVEFALQGDMDLESNHFEARLVKS